MLLLAFLNVNIQLILLTYLYTHQGYNLMLQNVQLPFAYLPFAYLHQTQVIPSPSIVLIILKMPLL